MKITKTISVSGLVTNYEFSYNSIEADGNTMKNFRTEDGIFNDEDRKTIRYGMDEFYDNHRKTELNKITNRAGGLTALGLLLIALITTLSLTLKKQSNKLVVEPPKKASKIKPSIPVKKSEPWKEIENVAKKKSR